MMMSSRQSAAFNDLNSIPALKKTAIFPGSYTNLESICLFVIEAARQAGFDEMTVYSIETAVDEACSNIIDHAYCGEGKGDIECTCEDEKTAFRVVLRDHGQPFNPQSIPDPDLHTTLENRKEHGLGLYFIRKMMDEVHFDFSPIQGNTLTLVKQKRKCR